MPQAGMEVISKEIIRGVKNAWNEYYKISGGEWLYSAPEYFLVVKIFQSLANNLALLLDLEKNVYDLLWDSNAKSKGKYPKCIRKEGKSDIVVWWKGGYPRGVIEVKVLRKNSYGEVKSDLCRIREILRLAKKQKDSCSLQFVAICVYTDYDDVGDIAYEKVKVRLDNIISLSRGEAKKYEFKLRIKTYLSRKNPMGCAVCMFNI